MLIVILKIDFFFLLRSIIDFHIKMDTLTDEFLHICAYLSDKDNVHLSATSIRLSVIKFRILFFTKAHIKDIIHLPYFHQFSNVIMSDTNDPLPKRTSCLTFNNRLNKSVNSCIPKSVTHLTFGYDFNQSIKDCIPDLVTHLIFGHNFNQPINSCIPKSVTHLTFGWNFNQPINSCIPDSVTHLTFGWDFNQSMDPIANSAISILLSCNYKLKISEKILPKVTIRR